MKPEFLTDLKAEQLNRWQWKLLDDLMFVGADNQVFIASRGTVTNFASVKAIRTFAVRLIVLWLLLILVPQLSGLVSIWVPLVLQPYMLLGWVLSLSLYAAVIGYGNKASTIHDDLYRAGQLPRAYCDWVFFCALRAEGVAYWRAVLMWLGVRLGGRKHYGNQCS